MVTKCPGQRIDAIFDQYWSPSIKDNERSLRLETVQMQFIISGPEQVSPTDFSKELKNIRFKEPLIDFFTAHWASNEIIPFLGTKLIHLNFRNCYSHKVNDGIVKSSVLDDLRCPLHEEADSKIIYHICSIPDLSNIVIRVLTQIS